MSHDQNTDPNETTSPDPLQMRDFWPAGLIAAASWAVALWAYPRLPERVPVHFGLDGTPDRWGSPVEGALLLPAVLTGTILLLVVLPRLDPRRRNYAKFRGVYATLVVAVAAVVLAVQLLILPAMFGRDLVPMRLIAVPLGLLMLVIGNLMPKLRANWFAGIRTPWTLDNEQVWLHTHRFAGRLFVVVGLVMTLVGFFSVGKPAAMVFVFVLPAVAALASVAYSYLCFRRFRSQGTV